MPKITLTWDADGTIDSYSIYRSEQPIDINNLPTPLIENVTQKSFIDESIAENTDYYYRVASVQASSIKVSEQIFVEHIQFLLNATVYAGRVDGNTLPNSNITAVVDTSLAANMEFDGSKITGKTLPNSEITITVED